MMSVKCIGEAAGNESAAHHQLPTMLTVAGRCIASYTSPSTACSMTSATSAAAAAAASGVTAAHLEGCAHVLRAHQRLELLAVQLLLRLQEQLRELLNLRLALVARPELRHSLVQGVLALKEGHNLRVRYTCGGSDYVGVVGRSLLMQCPAAQEEWVVRVPVLVYTWLVCYSAGSLMVTCIGLASPNTTCTKC
jgi:hypothetical protein